MENDIGGRAEAVQCLVELFGKRKGDVHATLVNGEACKVDSVRNLSTDHHAVLEIVLETGQVLQYKGSAASHPGLGEEFFTIRFVDARAPDFDVAEGTIPRRVEIHDGGYASLYGEMSMASPRDPELELVLVDTGAEAFNRPILEAKIEELRQQRAEEKLRNDANRKEEELNNNRLLAKLTSDIREVFGPTIDLRIEVDGTPKNPKGLTIIVGDKKLSTSHDSRTGAFVIEVV